MCKRAERTSHTKAQASEPSHASNASRQKKEKITGIHKEKDKITRICVNKHKNHQAGSYIQNKIIKRNRTNIMPVLVTGYSRLG